MHKHSKRNHAKMENDICFDLPDIEMYGLHLEKTGKFFVTPKGKFHWSSISAAKNAYLIHKFKTLSKTWEDLIDPPTIIYVGKYTFNKS